MSWDNTCRLLREGQQAQLLFFCHPCSQTSAPHRDKGVRMAVASRTPTPPVASAFLRKLGATPDCSGTSAQARIRSCLLINASVVNM